MFLTIAYPKKGSTNLYTDLMDEFKLHGHDIHVVCQCERRTGLSTRLENQKGINILRVRTGNLTKTNTIEKGISTLAIERQFINAIKKNLADVNIDLLIYSTPPITFLKVIEYLKKNNNCFSYLVLKDIFPQNAVDLGMIKRNSLLWRYFAKKEKKLYKISDKIGCMSSANVTYLLAENKIDDSKVEICRNSIKPRNIIIDEAKKAGLRKKHNIPGDAVVFIFGGNLGAPQGIDFLMDSFKAFSEHKKAYMLIIGSGTRYNDIKERLEKSKYRNIRLLPFMGTGKFDEMLMLSDVGLIFLDKRFTIPNFPSRLNSYFEYSLPVLAATDDATDVRELLMDNDCGYWCSSGNQQVLLKNIREIINDEITRKIKGKRARTLLENEFHVEKSYSVIISSYNRRKINVQ